MEVLPAKLVNNEKLQIGGFRVEVSSSNMACSVDPIVLDFLLSHLLVSPGNIVIWKCKDFFRNQEKTNKL